MAGTVKTTYRQPAFFAALAAAFLACAPAKAQDEAALAAICFTTSPMWSKCCVQSSLQVGDPKAVFAFVLNSLPDRVKVYPTENYYYFRFVHNGAQYAGNVRLDNESRDQGKIHIAYSIDFAEWKDEDPAMHQLLGQSEGVIVEKLDRLIYRVSYGARASSSSLTISRTSFRRRARSRPTSATSARVRRFRGAFLSRLQHQTEAVSLYSRRDRFDRPLCADAKSDRILIGKRTGFAFYRDHHVERKILIGVFEGNSRSTTISTGRSISCRTISSRMKTCAVQFSRSSRVSKDRSTGSAAIPAARHAT